MFHMKQYPQERLQALEEYIELVMKWNKKINLTSYTKEELVKIGVFDAMVLLELLKILKIDEIIDIGTGYGMPGVVLKILSPSLNVHLLDGSEKKIAFLEYVSKILHIPMTIYFKRLPDKRWGKKFNCIVSKASMQEKELLNVCSNIMASQGFLIYYAKKEPKRNCHLPVVGSIFYKREIGDSYLVVRRKC